MAVISPDFPHSKARSGPGFRPVPRDFQIVDLVYRCRLLRDDQIQVSLFTVGNAAGCQRSLTRLVRQHWLSTLPGRAATEPARYLLDRQSVVGNRLMKLRYGEAEFRARMHKLGSIPHQLGINDVRVRVERGVRDLGWELKLWQTAEELGSLLGPTQRLIPDAYFQIARPSESGVTTAGFFLELQASLRSSNSSLISKLRRYADFYYSQAYERRFGIRAMRILIVYSSELGVPGEKRVQAALRQSRSLGFTRSRFTSLDQIRSASPVELLASPLWATPDQEEMTSLYSLSNIRDEP